MNKANFFTLICVTLFSVISSCKFEKRKDKPQELKKSIIKEIHYSLDTSYSHDTTLFTEGLEFFNGKLYESTGSPENLLFTESLIGCHDFDNIKFKELVKLEKKIYFGEGITFLDNKLYQVTYQNQKGFIYDTKKFNRVDEFAYPNKEGWGLTTEGKNIIMSDGTNKLTFFDPKNFNTPVKILEVFENGFARDSINELEYINGFVYANIWMTNFIIKIDPNNGIVVGKLDLTSLVNEVKSLQPSADVLNGIAYNPISNKVYVTGKLWPKLYVIDFTK